MLITPLTSNHLEPWARLLSVAFDQPLADMLTLWDWLHAGREVLTWGAWDGPRLIAQYSSLLTPLRLPGQPALVRVGVCANMAVHPDYRGRGLVKRLAQPIYDALREHETLAGVGFSNAAGVQVDKHSRGYGYRVVGQLTHTLVWLKSSRAEPVDLTTAWPTEAWCYAPITDNQIHFGATPASVRQRFAAHPFRHYRFGVWKQAGKICGVVIDRPVKRAGLSGASLLAAYADDLPELLARWAAALRNTGVRFVSGLTSPTAPLRAALSTIGCAFTWPFSQSPYYLTVKPLCPKTAAPLLEFARWDCVGGDIL